MLKYNYKEVKKISRVWVIKKGDLYMQEKVVGTEKNIVFYNDNDGNTNIEVILQDEDIWLNTVAIAELFNVQDKAIYKHIDNIYTDEELIQDSTFSILENVGKNGQKYKTKYYNLDMIISIGFRVNSKTAIKFRTWANKILKEYMVQGFALDDNRFMKGRKTDQEYFKRLLERIKLIRTSERMFYQKVTDVFAECSIDYDKNSKTARDFYATIQNKLHFAVTKNTAAEIIYNRANHIVDNMGLTTWEKSPDGKVLKNDVIIAKNYLKETEIKELNNVVNMYLDLVENRAERQISMKMQDWIRDVESILTLNYYEILKNKGKISAEIARKKAESEYEIYKVIQDQKFISDFDRLIIETEEFDGK